MIRREIDQHAHTGQASSCLHLSLLGIRRILREDLAMHTGSFRESRKASLEIGYTALHEGGGARERTY